MDSMLRLAMASEKLDEDKEMLGGMDCVMRKMTMP